MLRRLGPLLASLGIAAGLALGGAAPAAAATGNCYAINVSGNATASSVRTFDGFDYRLRVAELVGSTYGTCATNLSWELRFSRSSGEVGSTASGSPSYNPLTDKTSVSFPSLLLDVPSGNGTLALTIRTVAKTSYGFSFYPTDGTRTVYVQVPNTFNTATGENVSTSSACYLEPDQQKPLGFGGWC